MGVLFIILIAPSVLAFSGAFFISAAVRFRLEKTGNKHPKTVSVVTFIASFLVILAACYFIIDILNIRFER